MYVKVNDIKNCKLDKDLAIPCSLYYNKECTESRFYNINKSRRNH